MNGIEDVFLKNFILQFTDDENTELNKILGSLNFAIFTNRILFDVKIVDGLIQPLDALSKVIGIKDIDMFLKLTNNAGQVVGVICFEKCKLLKIKNFNDYLEFSLRNSYDKIERLEVEYRFERVTYNGMTLLEGNNPLNSLKGESSKKSSSPRIVEDPRRYEEEAPMAMSLPRAGRWLSETGENNIEIEDVKTSEPKQDVYTDYERIPTGILMKG